MSNTLMFISSLPPSFPSSLLTFSLPVSLLFSPAPCFRDSVSHPSLRSPVLAGSSERHPALPPHCPGNGLALTLSPACSGLRQPFQLCPREAQGLPASRRGTWSPSSTVGSQKEMTGKGLTYTEYLPEARDKARLFAM